MGKESRMYVLKGQVCIFSLLFEKIRIAFVGLSWSRGKIIYENTEVENPVWYSPFTLLNKYCRGRRGKVGHTQASNRQALVFLYKMELLRRELLHSRHAFTYSICSTSIKWFIEDQAFLRSYDSAPPSPPFPPLLSASCLSFSVFLSVAGLAN